MKSTLTMLHVNFQISGIGCRNKSSEIVLIWLGGGGITAQSILSNLTTHLPKEYDPIKVGELVRFFFYILFNLYKKKNEGSIIPISSLINSPEYVVNTF